MGAVFGSSEAVFGSSGPATFLSKLTTGLVVTFMLTSLGLTYMSAKRGNETIMQHVTVTQPTPSAPVKSEAAASPPAKSSAGMPLRPAGPATAK